MITVRRLRDAWAARRRSRSRRWHRGGRGAVRPVFPASSPVSVFLFGDPEPDSGESLVVFTGEVRAWRTLAEMETARSRVWSRQGRVWGAGVCAGRAQVYQAVAEQFEGLVIESPRRGDDERRPGGDHRDDRYG
ncbi:hypothetical protein E1281_08250 [Actinomadura sp. KC345]|uniref:hypothetical protein n=1 Tax=Actinomadura sp. KC345 TaxID=2530371 RepID=UPI00104DD05A|nr:hypothetical protein [Actinomadura sp. KC345]TDC56253.1 hypothetical protein E1281_08250 [Actinomadura sp. KC345]